MIYETMVTRGIKMPPLALKPNGGNMPSLTKNKCPVEGCDKVQITKGYCKYHYQRFWRKQNPLHPLYDTWSEMRQRCNNPNSARYKWYGGRGIKICKRWDNFALFLADMGERPEGYSIDRIDNDGNYEPSNCKWSTAKQQAANRRLQCNNTSGYAGVQAHGKRWRVKWQSKHVGVFNTKEEAIAKRKCLENKRDFNESMEADE